MEYRTRYAPSHPNASASGCVTVHVLVAERAIGRHLKDDEQVHHVDENKKNNANANLVICQDMQFHKLLHVRTRVVRAGGDPNTQRVCSTCRRLKLIGEFNRSSANVNGGVQNACRECSNKYNRSYVRRSNREAA